jgi:hypothetical protein
MILGDKPLIFDVVMSHIYRSIKDTKDANTSDFLLCGSFIFALAFYLSFFHKMLQNHNTIQINQKNTLSA